jgi:hypothetical protein
MGNKKKQKDWFNIKLEQVLKKYNLSLDEGLEELLKKASKVIPTSHK